jgi:hypothetical protein
MKKVMKKVMKKSTFEDGVGPLSIQKKVMIHPFTT